MKKTLITAAAVAMSAGLVGVAAAASGDSTAREQAPAVSSPSGDRGRGAEPGDDHGSGGHGADDPVTHDAGDDKGGDRAGRSAEPGEDHGGRESGKGDDHRSGGHGPDD